MCLWDFECYLLMQWLEFSGNSRISWVRRYTSATSNIERGSKSPKCVYRAVVDRYGVLVEAHALIADVVVEKRSVTVDVTKLALLYRNLHFLKMSRWDLQDVVLITMWHLQSENIANISSWCHQQIAKFLLVSWRSCHEILLDCSTS